jgi:hypothetical protein
MNIFMMCVAGKVQPQIETAQFAGESFLFHVRTKYARPISPKLSWNKLSLPNSDVELMVSQNSVFFDLFF